MDNLFGWRSDNDGESIVASTPSSGILASTQMSPISSHTTSSSSSFVELQQSSASYPDELSFQHGKKTFPLLMINQIVGGSVLLDL